jgi:two-component system sensor histidine kinase QseC
LNTHADTRTKGGRRSSVRKHLILSLVGAIGLLWLLLSAVGWYGARHEAREIADDGLMQTAAILLAIVVHESKEGYHEPEKAIAAIIPAAHSQDDGDHDHVLHPAFVAWNTDGHILLHSADAAPLLKQLPQELTDGFHEVTLAGEPWRLLSQHDPSTGLRIMLGLSAHAQDQLAQELARHFISPLPLVLPLLGIVIYFAVNRGLAVLLQLADKVADHPIDRDHPFTDELVPREVLPLPRALDALLQRLHQAQLRERRFLADATHELRTPLAGLKTQAQVALGAATDEQRTEALDSLVLGVDRATRLISQLLTLARLAPQTDHKREHDETTDLSSITDTVAFELDAKMQAAGVELRIEDGQPPPVRAERTLLTILIRNLTENALHYSQAGQAITIGLDHQHGETLLTVRDQGPGITEQDLERVLERFYRGSNQPSQGHHSQGSGLGLAIVKAIVDRCHADIELYNHPNGGLMVEVRFGTGTNNGERVHS